MNELKAERAGVVMASRLPCLERGTDDGPPQEVAQAIRDALSGMFDTEFPDMDQYQLDLRTRVYVMGPALLSRARLEGGEFRFTRDAEKIATSSLDLISIYLYLEGTESRCIEGVDQIAETGDIGFLDLTRTSSVSAASFVQNLILPRSLLEGSKRNLDHLHGLILRKGSVANTLLGAHLRALWLAAAEASLEDGPALIDATTGLIAGLLLSGPESDQDQHDLADAQFVRIRRYINRHLGDATLGPDRLCDQLGLSRAALYRHMAPLGGVADYIRTQRLRKVYLTLCDPSYAHLSVMEVAAVWGFGDASGFYRSFKRKYSLNPSELRVYPEVMKNPQTNTQRKAPFVTDWLVELDEETGGKFNS